jgi:hypothetical protein
MVRSAIYIVVLIAVIIGGTALGVYGVWEQHRKNTRFVPVIATVEGRWVESFSGKDDGKPYTAYRPAVSYSYEVGGRRYRSSFIIPSLPLAAVEQSTPDEAVARERVSRWQIGQTTTAYYDPANPADAYLVRSYAFLPYLSLVIALLWVPALPAVHALYGHRQLAPDPLRLGWYVFPRLDATPTFIWCILASVVWLVFVVWLVPLHYTKVAGHAIEQRGVLWAAAAMGLFMSVPVAFLSRGGIWFGPLTVRIDRLHYVLGDTVRVGFTQLVHRPFALRMIQVKLTARWGREGPAVHDISVERTAAELRQVGNAFSGEVEIPLPQADPARKPELDQQVRIGRPPRCNWRLVAGAQATGGRTISWGMTLDVRPAVEAAPPGATSNRSRSHQPVK